MRGSVTTQAVLFSLAFAGRIAAKDDQNYNSSLNFRPNNVTLSDLYYWVGSYYNGTTDVEFVPDLGLAANDSLLCPTLPNGTLTRHYDTVLALTEPSIYNSGFDPVNAFLTLWPPDFNFSTLPLSEQVQDFPSLEFALFSSQPAYSVSDDIQNYFDWTLNATEGPPYSLFSALPDYNGIAGPAGFYLSWTQCNGTGDVEWLFAPIDFNISQAGLYLPDPVIDLQFDGRTANLSLEGYFGGYEDTNSVLLTVGKFKLSFSGVLDAYHSDVLANNTATPTWLRTVGFQNNSLNVGYTSVASSQSVPGTLVTTTWIVVMFGAIFLAV
ncbi:hypothetical protein BO78DRAFT_339471 [Aspergillus sclerotiicarbonarius CBS 121057]|uniref:Concanavalin A-like lectin/glucanase n=1 Tax=Aspergillus sclerotiicarbonarius (strain CBS 121057 / IBT 28362) TaxID=1448318 RepID=A0A319EKX7_ASPSB|nr:hypothetical protein BO78DRAFT_339471 [Aspergillus sclerotiicarbonarius CBS 121057]